MSLSKCVITRSHKDPLIADVRSLLQECPLPREPLQEGEDDDENYYFDDDDNDDYDNDDDDDDNDN